MMIQYNRYALTLLPNFYQPHEQPFLQSNIIKESIYEKNSSFFFSKLLAALKSFSNTKEILSSQELPIFEANFQKFGKSKSFTVRVYFQ